MNLQMEIGNEALKSLAKRYGTQYDLGNMAETICKSMIYKFDF